MRIRLSSKRHIPIFDSLGREYYAWNIIDLASDHVRFNKYRRFYPLNVDFDYSTWALITLEYNLWKRFYLPARPLGEDAVILDAGAGAGETILFYSNYGYHNFVAVENDLAKCRKIEANTKHLNVELYRRAFRVEDLNNIDYAKLDIEGGEKELLQLEKLPCELTVEIHGANLLEKLMGKFPLNVVYRLGLPDEPVFIAKSAL